MATGARPVMPPQFAEAGILLLKHQRHWSSSCPTRPGRGRRHWTWHVLFGRSGNGELPLRRGMP
jgi:hypothetical protein